MAEFINPVATGTLLTGKRYCARSPIEFKQLAETLEANAGQWHIYSWHSTSKSADVRASRLRRSNYPLALMPYRPHIQFLSRNHRVEGPVVLVRWVH